jgi:16S rRNA (guanine527-N7)-methyltransferase
VAGRPELLDALERARAVGLLGPGPVVDHFDHASAWAQVLGPHAGPFLDLGAGAGIPGLVLLLRWPDATATFLDARRRSVEFLRHAVADLGWSGRVSVVEGRAEELGRDAGLREQFALVVARGFGPPAETAECGSAFVRTGGRLSVSEPPGGDPDRWPGPGLAELGLSPPIAGGEAGRTFVVLEKVAELQGRFPRRVGKPRRLPLW